MTSMIKACGLLIFAYIFVTTQKWYIRVVSMMIMLNGLLCHQCSHHSFVAWDVLCNALLTILVNVTTTKQPETAILSSLATLAFVLCSAPYPSSVACEYIHVCVVQGLLGIALSKWTLR